MYRLATVLPKLAICTLYLRVFNIDACARHVTYSMVVFLIANEIAWLVPAIFICRPISAYWTPGASNRRRCINYNFLGPWTGLLHILSDLVMLAIPIPVLWKLSMGVAKRIGLVITFAAASM